MWKLREVSKHTFIQTFIIIKVEVMNRRWSPWPTKELRRERESGRNEVNIMMSTYVLKKIK